jgi:hypothetical protein
MSAEGINASRIKGAAVEPMGEFVQLIFEADDGGEFIVRLPAQEMETAIPKLLTLPSRIMEEVDPFKGPSRLGGPGTARVLAAKAAVFRTNARPGFVLFELHIGEPPFPIFFSFPREEARRLIEAAASDLAKSSGKS